VTIPLRRGAAITVVTGLALVTPALPAAAAPVRDAAGVPACVAGTSPADARTLRPDDGFSYTDAERRRIDRGLRRELAADGQQRSTAAPRVGATLRIPVHVHVLGGTGDQGPSKKRVRQQLRILDSAYAGAQSAANSVTRFDFYLASFDRVRNTTWRTAVIGGRDDMAMRRALHRGGPEALNLYISRPQSPGAGTVLGWATPPHEARKSTALDGVVVHQDSLPGGDFRGYNRGDTAVHEVGHWLGLFHTFEGGCVGPGDLVDDTPAQSEASSACDETKDSCLAQPGTDPVHNFMDYSVDDCMDSFTPGQVARMQDNWLAYRTP
jgi:hypothetical protein